MSLSQTVVKLRRNAATSAGESTVIGLMPSDLMATISFDPDMLP